MYVNVEPINNAFLRRVFGSDEGNLYEGTLSDFRPDMVRTFDPKNNGEELGRSELEEFSAALMADDDVLLEALEPFVDIDAFILFWAVEGLIEHSDGFSAFRNNFYVYRDPANDQFRFIPWGVDIILTGGAGSVYARSSLAYRLYHLPEVQDRYFERLDALMTGVWDEESLDAEVVRMTALIAPALGTRRDGILSNIESLREVIASRRGRLTEQLAMGRPRFGGFPAPFMCR